MDSYSYTMVEPEPKRRIFSFISFGIAVLIFMILNIVSCKNPDSAFYNKVLNDFDTTSYFIAVDIKSPFYKGRTIIENNNLYLYLSKTKGFDKGKYIYFMKRTLRHHRALKVTDKDIIVWKFIKVTELESVIHVADQGRDNFVANYFNGTVINFGVTDIEQNAVINQLFYWEIPAKIDKLTGELMIG
ncbi:MAG: hypothetical protein WA816_15780 [Bacteroidales bacterium]